MKAWLRLFRVVNLPTVPGDVLVGAAAVLCTAPSLKMGLAPVWWTAASSVFLYMFGLAQNDVFGAKTDKDRPIPEGLISIRAVRSACAICLFLAWIVTWFPFRAHPGCFWLFSVYIVMTILVSVYNATKISLLMGLCRGLNVVYGGVAVAVSCARGSLLLLGAIFCIWTLYIWAVTIYSKGEEKDPAKKRRVGLLVGGIVYLQLSALILLTLACPRVMPLMVAGAVLLVLLRLFKKVFPEVSAS
jgi:4-hydroxybenzoate polyprenyltransferase